MERIFVKDLVLEYEKEVLKCQSLQLKTNNIYSLKGANGTGKSTFLKALTGIVKPYRGQISKIGEITYSPQKPCVFNLSVLENAMIGMKNKDKSRALNLLDRANIIGLANKNARLLSGGEKQRLCFVRTLLTGGEILLLDEPFSSIDENSVSTLEKILIEYKNDQRVIIVATHSEKSSNNLSTKHLIIENGELKLC